jgi:AraC-like DNA-binding protein
MKVLEHNLSPHHDKSDDTFGFYHRNAKHGGMELCLNFPDNSNIKDQRIELVPLSRGVTICLCECRVVNPVDYPFCYETDLPQLSLSFHLHGEASVSYDHDPSESTMSSGPQCFLNSNLGNGVHHFKKRGTIRHVNILFDTEAMHRLMGDAVVRVPRCFSSSTPPPPTRGNILRTPLTPFMLSAGHLALKSSTKTAHDRLLLESKMLELITLFLAALPSPSGRGAKVSAGYISPCDREKLHAARDILLAEYADPPAIMEVAKRVGLNECKLKQLFKQHFKTTMFAMVRKERMERAKQYLEQGLSVSLTADKVGYVNYSRFSQNFHKHFGLNPSEYKNSSRS